MAIKLANGDISALYLGSQAVSAAYLGSNAVYTAIAPPSQVTGLAVDSTGDGTIDLSWAAPASEAAITDYRVEYTPSGGSATEVLVGSAATSYQLTGLTNDTEYSVRVAAISAGGQGDYSAAVTGTPVAAAVTYLSGTSGGITGTGDSSASKFQSVSNSSILTVSINTTGVYYLQVDEGSGGPINNCRDILLNGSRWSSNDGGICCPDDGFYLFTQGGTVSAGSTIGVLPGNRFHIWKVA